ncbi:MAG TPA: serine hydrolase domain-containing protein [Candidatus Udaeobacter sp.]|jgi:CubicO group peptidase (beta-lactamase class C family)|nr:serine hydrolase domain-containing protein [Candidatus Udaeobacter sp.]
MQLDSEKLHQRLQPLFQENFEKLGELGAAISVWQNGKPVVDLCGGFCDASHDKAWTADTLVLVWSATKGIGSACVLHALQQRKIELHQTVAEFWPEFAQANKDKITLGQLLSHQAGLCALDQRVDVLDYGGVIRALEAQAPLWPPGTAHGYHARTFGFLLDELIRRITAKTLSDYWQENFARPLELDFWIGLPERENSRVATIYAAKSGKPPEPAQFYRDLVTPGTLARKTFTSPYGLNAISKMNDPEIRSYPNVSFGGIGTASALAKFYSMLANGGELNGQTFFPRETIERMTTMLSDGTDRVFQIPTAFSAGFMKDSRGGARRLFGPFAKSFGHPGAGGSHAFADPENKIAFAYVMNQMEQSVLPNDKSLRLINAIYDLL